MALTLDELTDRLVRLIEANEGRQKEQALRPLVRKLRARLAQAFRRQGADFVRRMAKKRSGFAIQEALRAEDLSSRLSEAALRREDFDPYFDENELATIQTFVDALNSGYMAALIAGGQRTMASLGVEGSFTLANPQAAAWLEGHALEQSKLIQGATKTYIQGILQQAIEEGWSYQKTAKAITGRYEEFARGVPQKHLRSRAEMIATYELGEGYEAGSFAVVQRLMGAGLQMEKSWLTVGDARVSELCRANQAQGWIPAEQAYSSGHMHPQGHPACRCTGLSRMHREGRR